MEFYAPVQGPPGTFGYEQQNPQAQVDPADDQWQQQQHQQHQQQQQQQQVPPPPPPPPGRGGQTADDAAGLQEAMWQLSLGAGHQQHHHHQDDDESLPMSPFPERPGEPDCVYYMRTGLCAFGMSCRYNHPPNRKLAAAIARGKGEYPERPGQQECQYYLKTGTCKFGATCKYHHPRDKAGLQGRVQLNMLGFPLRVGEKDCAYYMRTGSCKFGVTCKFNHPQPAAAALGLMSPGAVYGATATPAGGGAGSGGGSGSAPSTPQGWQLARPYIPSPRSNYPPVLLPSPQGMVSLQGWNTYHDGQPSAMLYGASPHGEPLSYSPYSPTMGLPAMSSGSPPSLPERPGMPDCQYFLKTGDCKYGASCRFHHPKLQTPASPAAVAGLGSPGPIPMLSPIGLPLRPGTQPCSFYLRYGLCKFGPSCKFDHPVNAIFAGPLNQYPITSAGVELHREPSGPMPNLNFGGSGGSSESTSVTSSRRGSEEASAPTGSGAATAAADTKVSAAGNTNNDNNTAGGSS